jgi:hypothetical protein
MAPDAIAVRGGCVRNVFKSIFVALDASILIGKRSVNFVTIGASLMGFWATRQK